MKLELIRQREAEQREIAALNARIRRQEAANNNIDWLAVERAKQADIKRRKALYGKNWRMWK